MIKKFYLTTAIDYPNYLPHLGHAYEKVAADVLARFYRFCGYDTFFLMGNDEHSINVERQAVSLGMEPLVYCDKMAEEFKKVWKELFISHDDFIRTTEDRHVKAVQTLFQKIYEKGDIYKGFYRGWYCISCEAFLLEKDLVDGKCPTHQRKPKWIEEENYFFSLSRYQEPLLRHIESHPEFIQPEIRRNEAVNIIREGLRDISVSRASIRWGIPVPFDPTQVIYVWFDALVNYISGVGYPDDPQRFSYWWPADLHVVGKDIIRFHCIIWPALLMSTGLHLPKTIFGHGFVNVKGEKLSKSLGKILDPKEIIARYGADPLRYFLLREIVFGRDGDFSWEAYTERYNGDLANDLGNLVSRTLALIEQCFGGIIPNPGKMVAEDEVIKNQAEGLLSRLQEYIPAYEFHNGLLAIWDLIHTANRYIDETEPWTLASHPMRQATVLYNLMESLRFLSVVLSPFMPSTAERIWQQLGMEKDFSSVSVQDLHWGGLPTGIKIRRGKALFPRIDIKTRKGKAPLPKDTMGKNPEIELSEFQKIDLRVGQIVKVNPVPSSHKLYQLEVDLGREKRTVVAGIAANYSPQELIGRKVILVVNLKPARIRGIDSQGMILAADDAKSIALATFTEAINVGAKVE